MKVLDTPTPQGRAPEALHEPRYMSPSGIKAYLNCPAKYYYERVLKVELPISPALFIGSCVHEALASLHRSQMRGEPLSKDAVLAEYGSLFQSKLEDDNPVFTAKQTRQKVFETGSKLVDAYMESKLCADARPNLGVEIHLEEEIIPGSPPLLGIIDLVKEGEGGQLVIADIKTSAATPDMKTESWLNEVQLVAYAVLMRKALGKEVNQTELWYLVKTANPKVLRHQLEPLSDTQLDRFKSIYQYVADGIERQDFTPRPSFACRMCDFRDRCQQWRGGLPV